MRKAIITITIIALIISIVGTGVIVYIEGVSQDDTTIPASEGVTPEISVEQ